MRLRFISVIYNFYGRSNDAYQYEIPYFNGENPGNRSELFIVSIDNQNFRRRIL